MCCWEQKLKCTCGSGGVSAKQSCTDEVTFHKSIEIMTNKKHTHLE